MPLIEGKSNAARGENIKREIEAGRDPKQAAAIAYSVQRKAQAADAASTFQECLDSLRKLAADCMTHGKRR